MNIKNIIWVWLRFVVLSLIGIVIIFSTPIKASASSKDNIIIYGGIGNTSPHGQPYFSYIMHSNKQEGAASEEIKRFRSFIDAIRGPGGKLKELNNKENPIQMTSFPIIIDEHDIEKVLAKLKPGTRPKEYLTEKDIMSLIEYSFEKEDIYTLALVSTLEHYISMKHEISQNIIYEEHFIVGMSAIIVQLGTGKIVLAGSALTEIIKTDTKGPSSEIEKKIKFTEAYQNAAMRSIERLNLLKVSSEKKLGREMVTGLVVNSKSTRKLFKINKIYLDKVDSVCDLHWRVVDDKTKYKELAQPLCVNEGDPNCSLIVSILVHGVTERLSAAGHLAIPPLNIESWENATSQTNWKQTSEGEISKTLSLSEGLSDNLKVNVSPSSAERKLVVFLTKFAEKDFEGKTKYTANRVYKAWIKVIWAETDPYNCSIIEDEGSYGEVGSCKPAIQIRVSGSPVSGNERVIHYIIAILNALKGFEEHVKTL